MSVPLLKIKGMKGMIRREKKRLVKKITEYEENLEYWNGKFNKQKRYVTEMRIFGNYKCVLVDLGEADLERYEKEIVIHNRLINKLKKNLNILNNY